ncbi:hypothetical protein AAFF_G00211090 [Aldrovandia affinis]|uniref:Uncharacterized protein n=1 Tax=Aldrovandia affinis TaxID=143900 RepID=A0AAD7WV13_9TELE|nr:hypothetical protein AAFF_G00211090 [Aldrovandia affinis]
MEPLMQMLLETQRAQQETTTALLRQRIRANELKEWELQLTQSKPKAGDFIPKLGTRLQPQNRQWKKLHLSRNLNLSPNLNLSLNLSRNLNLSLNRNLNLSLNVSRNLNLSRNLNPSPNLSPSLNQNQNQRRAVKQKSLSQQLGEP